VLNDLLGLRLEQETMLRPCKVSRALNLCLDTPRALEQEFPLSVPSDLRSRKNHNIGPGSADSQPFAGESKIETKEIIRKAHARPYYLCLVVRKLRSEDMHIPA
jgi:hypothetical protein